MASSSTLPASSPPGHLSIRPKILRQQSSVLRFVTNRHVRDCVFHQNAEVCADGLRSAAVPKKRLLAQTPAIAGR
jgi:hypothetical protein